MKIQIRLIYLTDLPSVNRNGLKITTVFPAAFRCLRMLSGPKRYPWDLRAYPGSLDLYYTNYEALQMDINVLDVRFKKTNE